ncbi:trigger factor [Solirubrobacter soli]|uniref:trigger factor n=1 Tax=Solirubrobacter soli TaxID=363832 RepID=UPI00069E5D83|nr:trigger factor [Solirubrobacter soli]
MANDISTTTTELPESRVRVEAEVGSGEVERRMTQAARQLARNIRVPGFRAGKAPPPVVIKRVGREAVLDEAVRESLGSWYRAAIDDAHVVPVGEPEIDMSELPKEGEPLKFSIEIGVRPKATLGDYKGLEVGKREADVSDEAVAEEVDRLRERAAKLEPVERQAQRGDFVVMDFKGTRDGVPFAGGEGRDQMIELGSGRLVPGFEAQLEGTVAGEDLTVTVTFPDDYGSEELAGEVAEFAVTVREVKAKQLPELNDELAEEAGFDTLDELREDIRSRMAESEANRIEGEFREAALDAAVEAATIDVPDALIEARARELWDSMLHQLSHQGIDRETYLRISGRSEEETIETAKPDAEQALKREAVLAAVAEAESLEPSEEEMLEAVAEASPPGDKTSPKKLLERLRSNGRLDSLKDDLSQRKALDLLTESAKPVPLSEQPES